MSVFPSRMFLSEGRSQVGCRHATPPPCDPSVDSRHTVTDIIKALFFFPRRLIYMGILWGNHGPCIQSTHPWCTPIHPSNLLPHLSPSPPPLLPRCTARQVVCTYIPPGEILLSCSSTYVRLPCRNAREEKKRCSPGREEGIGDATRTTRARREESWPHTTPGSCSEGLPRALSVSHICFHGRIGNRVPILPARDGNTCITVGPEAEKRDRCRPPGRLEGGGGGF